MLIPQELQLSHKIYIPASQKRFNIVPFHKKEESQEKEEARL